MHKPVTTATALEVNACRAGRPSEQTAKARGLSADDVSGLWSRYVTVEGSQGDVEKASATVTRVETGNSIQRGDRFVYLGFGEGPEAGRDCVFEAFGVTRDRLGFHYLMRSPVHGSDFTIHPYYRWAWRRVDECDDVVNDVVLMPGQRWERRGRDVVTLKERAGRKVWLGHDNIRWDFHNEKGWEFLGREGDGPNE